MYNSLLQIHSTLRYVVLVFLVIVIIKSLLGALNKQPFAKADNAIGLFLFSVTHTQVLLGLILYFVSPFVQFNGSTMKDSTTRYWTVEHITIMLVAVVLITLARTTSKKMKEDSAKHKRIALFNSMALVLILVAIAMSKRGIF